MTSKVTPIIFAVATCSHQVPHEMKLWVEAKVN